MLIPKHNHRVLDAVLGQTGNLLDSAKREGVVRRKLVHGALVASRGVGHDDTCLSLEALSATIDQEAGDFVLGAVCLAQLVNHTVNPSAGFHVIQASDDHLELSEEIFAKFLHRIGVPVNLDTRASFGDECGSNLCLVLADVRATEEELSIEVGHVDLVKVDHVDVSEP